MSRYLFVLYLTLGLLVGAGFYSTAQAQREGCIPAVCENDGTCNCFNESADRRGCIVQECEEGGPICSCAYISSRGNPYGMHIRLTECLPNAVFNGEEPEPVYADCRVGKEIPIITEELHCQRECIVGNDCTPDPVGEVCGDDIDNDCDGLIDCLDTDCDTEPECNLCVPNPCQAGEICDPATGQCLPLVEVCGDGIDNDGDGLIDCSDTDCDVDVSCEACIPNPCMDGAEFCSGGVCLPVPN